ncbi:hypothetical protein V8C35DRAFT_281879 [Trichoderma chlorosporum]
MKKYTSLVAAVGLLTLVYGNKVTLNFEDLDISNDDKCGSMSFSDQPYAGLDITSATVVNSVGTSACKNPIDGVDLSNKLENNVLWGNSTVLLSYGGAYSKDLISGNLTFDVTVDYSLLADGELDDDGTKITVDLKFIDGVDASQAETLEFFMTKNGTGPFSISWNPEEGRYSAFTIEVDLWSTSLVIVTPMAAFDNIAFEHFSVDGLGNIIGGDDQTTTGIPQTTGVSTATSESQSDHTQTEAPATTSAPSSSGIPSSISVFSSSTRSSDIRTTGVSTSTSKGFAPTSGPALFGYAAVLAAGAALL